MPQLKLAICVCVIVADQKPAPVTIVGVFTPVDGLNLSLVVSYVACLDESAKNDYSAVTMLRRSDFIAAVYAFVFVLANFGIAIAARMPMMTTTINSSMSVKPRRAVLFMGRFHSVWEDAAQRGGRDNPLRTGLLGGLF